MVRYLRPLNSLLLALALHIIIAGRGFIVQMGPILKGYVAFQNLVATVHLSISFGTIEQSSYAKFA